tara:strand:+ start:528 stop:803 length:276 start_codon:yes stop_codon:yes gene_type:complete
MSVPTPAEFNNKYKVSVGLVVAIAIFAFSIGGAYYNNKATEANLRQEIDDLQSKLEYVNGRFGRKFERVEEGIENNDIAIRELQINKNCND